VTQPVKTQRGKGTTSVVAKSSTIKSASAAEVRCWSVRASRIQLPAGILPFQRQELHEESTGGEK
jgi:hypothetical protein